MSSCKEGDNLKQNTSDINLNTKTSLVQENNKWNLLLNNREFYIKGVTFGEKFNSENIDTYMKDLQSLGVNTIRTWGIDDNTSLLLDTAYKYNIKVILGIWLRHGQNGDNFDWVNDEIGKKSQFDEAIHNVNKFKGHPALLMWCVGNEVILNLLTEKEKTEYCLFLDNLCKKIKIEDSNHLVSSASASTYDASYWAKYVPALDLYGINAYGNNISIISDTVEKFGNNKPYILTEFGAEGEWAVEKDNNNLPIEPSDDEKFSIIENSWNNWIFPKENCLGAFVFNYGSNWDHGGIWLNMYMKDYKRPSYWAVKKIFTSNNSVKNPIIIGNYEFTSDVVGKNQWLPISYEINSSYALEKIEMYYNKRDGNNSDIIKLETKLIDDKLYFKTPNINGVLKIYLFAYDAEKNLGIAQKSIKIN